MRGEDDVLGLGVGRVAVLLGHGDGSAVLRPWSCLGLAVVGGDGCEGGACGGGGEDVHLACLEVEAAAVLNISGSVGEGGDVVGLGDGCVAVLLGHGDGSDVLRPWSS